MEKENLTPAQLVEPDVITSIEPGTPEWLFSFMPDFEEKMRIWRESGFADSFSKQYFSAALAAFEAYVWRRACEAQRVECANHWRVVAERNDGAAYHMQEPEFDAILNTPIPEIPKK